MPGGDRTGPMGMGPMTGRGAGYCAGYPTPGFMNAGTGRGFGFGRGRGFGRGFGWGRWGSGYWGAGYGAFPYQPAVAPAGREQQLQMLNEQARELKATLDDLNGRIRELTKDAEAAAE